MPCQRDLPYSRAACVRRAESAPSKANRVFSISDLIRDASIARCTSTLAEPRHADEVLTRHS